MKHFFAVVLIGFLQSLAFAQNYVGLIVADTLTDPATGAKLDSLYGRCYEAGFMINDTGGVDAEPHIHFYTSRAVFQAGNEFIPFMEDYKKVQYFLTKTQSQTSSGNSQAKDLYLKIETYLETTYGWDVILLTE